MIPQDKYNTKKRTEVVLLVGDEPSTDDGLLTFYKNNPKSFSSNILSFHHQCQILIMNLLGHIHICVIKCLIKE